MRAWPPWLSRLSISALRRSARRTTLRRGRDRRAWAAPARPPAPRAPGTDAPARWTSGSGDQLVVAVKGTDLDDRLAAALGALIAQRAGVLQRGDRAMPRERSRMAAGDLSGCPGRRPGTHAGCCWPPRG